MDWLDYGLHTAVVTGLGVLATLAWWAIGTVAEYRAYVFRLRARLAATDIELAQMRRRKLCPACAGVRVVNAR